MKKIIKMIGITGIITILLSGVYLLGTTQAKTITEIKEIEKFVGIIPDNIDTNIDTQKINIIDLTESAQIYYVESENDFDTLLDALENRNGKIIIEVINGTVNDMEGNGIDINGYYIKYDNTRFLKGDQVQTILIYNPDTNSTDDILYRIDTLIK